MKSKTNIERKKKLSGSHFFNADCFYVSINKETGSAIIFIHSKDSKVKKYITIYPASFYSTQEIKIENDSNDEFYNLRIESV